MDLLEKLNRRHQRRYPRESELEARIQNYELAAKMQLTASSALDLKQESKETHALYGLDNPVTAAYGSRVLMARRLGEAGVRFVQVFPPVSPSFQPWDNHNNLPKDLPNICRQTEQPSAALGKDLKRRGLLDDVIVMWTGEFGRLPISEAKDGRDHNRNAFSLWMAGGGFRAGHVHGGTDDFGYAAVEDRERVADLPATVLQRWAAVGDELHSYSGSGFYPPGNCLGRLEGARGDRQWAHCSDRAVPVPRHRPCTGPSRWGGRGQETNGGQYLEWVSRTGELKFKC